MSYRLAIFMFICMTRQYIDLSMVQKNQDQKSSNDNSQENNNSNSNQDNQGESSNKSNSNNNQQNSDNFFPKDFPLQPNNNETPLNECSDPPKIDLLQIFSDLPVESMDCDIQYLEFKKREEDLKILTYLKCQTVSENLVSNQDLWFRVEGEVEDKQLKKGKIPFENQYFRWLISPSEKLLRKNVDQNNSLSCEQTKHFVDKYLVTSNNQIVNNQIEHIQNQKNQNYLIYKNICRYLLHYKNKSVNFFIHTIQTHAFLFYSILCMIFFHQYHVRQFKINYKHTKIIVSQIWLKYIYQKFQFIPTYMYLLKYIYKRILYQFILMNTINNSYIYRKSHINYQKNGVSKIQLLQKIIFYDSANQKLIQLDCFYLSTIISYNQTTL